MRGALKRGIMGLIVASVFFLMLEGALRLIYGPPAPARLIRKVWAAEGQAFTIKVGKVTATGWNLEIRVPFSSLRYAKDAAPTWGILLYRNYPRDRHYQFFSARLPRDVNCFICNSRALTGLADSSRQYFRGIYGTPVWPASRPARRE